MDGEHPVTGGNLGDFHIGDIKDVGDSVRKES